VPATLATHKTNRARRLQKRETGSRGMCALYAVGGYCMVEVSRVGVKANVWCAGHYSPWWNLAITKKTGVNPRKMQVAPGRQSVSINTVVTHPTRRSYAQIVQIPAACPYGGHSQRRRTVYRFGSPHPCCCPAEVRKYWYWWCNRRVLRSR